MFLKNNRGFVVTVVLYFLFIVYLALIANLLAMLSTRRKILETMKEEIIETNYEEPVNLEIPKEINKEDSLEENEEELESEELLENTEE